MVNRYKNTFRDTVSRTIKNRVGAIVLRSDLNNLGNPRQISRALKALIEDGELIKLGYGVYVKAEKTKYSDEPIMIISMAEACAEALKRLGIRWELGKAIQDYNLGKTQQVPAKFIVRLKSRFRRDLGYNNRKIIFEGKVNAK